MKRLLATAVLLSASVSLAAGSDVKKKANKEGSAIQQIEALIEKSAVDKSDSQWRTKLTKPEMATFDSAHSYFADVETNKGSLRIRLMPDVAPMHVTSFIYLTKLGFYDGLSFHRVIPGFMAQGGCPLGTGTGDPGYRYDGEYSPDVKHSRPGLLSTANTGRPTTDGSQFFLTFVPTPHLDGKHTIYGEVVDGMSTLKKLEEFGSRSGRTSEPLRIDKVTIAVE